MAEPVVVTANRRVPIELACRLVGVPVPELLDRTKSLKVRCPFGDVYHDDGGAEPALRVYPGPNNAWCFACGEFFTPVKLCAMAWDLQPETAALQLLDRIGYKPADYAHHWQAVSTTPPPDGHALAQALQFYCERIDPNWQVRQHEDEVVSGILAKCLGLIVSINTEAEADAWLATTQQVMAEVLRTREEVNRCGHP